MRFVLIDAEQRLFAAERWCYRGSIDGWFPIGRSGPLPKLVEQFTRHLVLDLSTTYLQGLSSLVCTLVGQSVQPKENMSADF